MVSKDDKESSIKQTADKSQLCGRLITPDKVSNERPVTPDKVSNERPVTPDKVSNERPVTQRRSTRFRQAPQRMNGILTGFSLEKQFSPKLSVGLTRPTLRRCPAINYAASPRRSTRKTQPPNRMDGILTGETLEKCLTPISKTSDSLPPPIRRSTRKSRPPSRMDGILTGKCLDKVFSKNELGVEFLKEQVMKNICNKPLWVLDKYMKGNVERSCWRTGYLYSPTETGVWVSYYGWISKWDTFIRWNDEDILGRLCYPLVDVLSQEQIINTKYNIQEEDLVGIHNKEEMETFRKGISLFRRKLSGTSAGYKGNLLTSEQIRKSLEYIQEKFA